MQLRVSNFRCWQDKVWELPMEGMVLLCADNGRGKTTMMLALMHCLYGNVARTAPLGKPKAKTTVSLTFSNHDTTIVRTNRSASLTVTLGGVVYREAEAQGKIDAFMGKTVDEFYHSCTLMQGEEKLLSLSSSQLLNLLESLSCTDLERKTLLKSNCKVMLSKLHTEIASLSASVDTLKSVLGTCDKMQKQRRVGEVDVEISSTAALLREAREQQLVLQQQYTTACRNNVQLQEIHSALEALEGELTTLQESLAVVDAEAVPDTSTIPRDIERLCGERVLLLQDKKARLSFDSAETAWRESRARRKKAKRQQQRSQEARLSLLEQQRMLQSRVEEIVKLEQQLDCMGEIVQPSNLIITCPGCLSNIHISTALGVSCTDEPATTPCTTEAVHPVFASGLAQDILHRLEQCRECEKELDSVQQQLSKATTSNNIAVKVLKATPVKPKPIQASPLQQIQMGLDRIEGELQQLRKLEQAASEHRSTRSTTVAAIDRVSASIKGLKDRQSKLAHTDPAPVQAELQSISEQIQQSDTSLDGLRQQRSLSVQYQQWKKQYRTWLANSKRIKEMEKELMDKQQLLSNALFLSDCISKAEVVSLQNICSTINTAMEQYCQAFFPESAPTVALAVTKQVGQGSSARDSIALNTFICLKGEPYHSVKELSEGESRKVDLAAMLALGQVVGSSCIPFPKGILLLDECLANLHADMQMEMLQMLKQRGGLCIVVGHEVVKGMFDECISW